MGHHRYEPPHYWLKRVDRCNRIVLIPMLTTPSFQAVLGLHSRCSFNFPARNDSRNSSEDLLHGKQRQYAYTLSIPTTPRESPSLFRSTPWYTNRKFGGSSKAKVRPPAATTKSETTPKVSPHNTNDLASSASLMRVEASGDPLTPVEASGVYVCCIYRIQHDGAFCTSMFFIICYF